MTDQERFEKWAKGKRWNLRRDGDGRYHFVPIEAAWEAWQADAARHRRTIERLAATCIYQAHGAWWIDLLGLDEEYATREEAVAAVIAWAESDASPAASDQPSE